MTELRPDRRVADSIARSPTDWAPMTIRPYLRLARVDRPVGFWLLSIPCWAGIALARSSGGWAWSDLGLAALLTLGAIAMRAAGCTYNDIVDKDLDASVARTADRPLAAGTVSLRAAWMFLAAQLAVGLVVLIVIPRAAQLVALGAIPIIAAYPFMKRITWFPQAWLGLAMNWGMLVAYATVIGHIDLPALVAFAGLWAWTFGYDTIYAHQDAEDDALVGIKSTARLFGHYSKLAVGASYVFAAIMLYFAAVLASPFPPVRWTGIAPVLAFGALLALQVWRVRLDNDQSCLRWFKFNRETGLALTAGLLVNAVLVAD